MRVEFTILSLFIGSVLSLAGCRDESVDQGWDAQQSPSGEAVAPEQKPIPEPEQATEQEETLEKGLEENSSMPSEVGETAPSEPVSHAEADFLAGSVDDVMFMRLFAESFSELEPKRRALAYHLARAVLIARDIAFDQIHRDGLEVRNLVESVLENNVDTDPKIEMGISTYLQLLWINSGFYDTLTGAKFAPPFTFEQFERATKAANAVGAELGLAKGEPLEGKLSRLRRVIFDLNHQPILASPRPLHAQDILMASNLNLYSEVSMRDLARFHESYTTNSRLIRIDDQLVEEVYRVGDKRRMIPPGRYAQELRRVVRRLHDSIATSRRAEREILVNLVEYLRTGDAAAFEDAQRAWLAAPFEVEFSFGFTDTGIDPRGKKGLISGMVGVWDHPSSSRIATIARYAQYFENVMPWEPDFHRQWSGKPVASTVQLLVVMGRSSPVCAFGHRLAPGTDLGGDGSRKILVFSNVVESYSQVVGAKVVREFLEPIFQEPALSSLGDILLTWAAIREVLGGDLGFTVRSVQKRLRDTYAPIKALKAELSALWLLADPKITELGLLSGNEAVLSAYRYFVAEFVAKQALVDSREVRQTDLLAQRMIARFLVEKAKVVTLKEEGGKIYPVISDVQEFRQALSRLLVNCERVLATGERRMALNLLRKYSEPPNWPFLKKLADRARAAGLKRMVACVMPKLTPHRLSSGKVVDVTISHRETFQRQMMRYRRY